MNEIVITFKDPTQGEDFFSMCKKYALKPEAIEENGVISVRFKTTELNIGASVEANRAVFTLRVL